MISVDDDLLSRVDRVRELLHAQAPAPDVEDRSALISHLLRLWLLEKGERPSEDPDRALVPAAEERQAPRLEQVIFNILERDVDRSWTPAVLRAFVRMSIPSITLRDIKDTLFVMAYEGLILEELHTVTRKPMGRYQSATGSQIEGAPVKAAVDAGLISFDFAAHEAARAAKRAEAVEAQAAITQRRAGTRDELRKQYEEAGADARRLEEMRDNARLALVVAEKSANAEYLEAHPKPDTMGGDPEILKLSLDERRVITRTWAAGRAAHVEAAIAMPRDAAARLEAEASAARLRSDALAARLAELV